MFTPDPMRQAKRRLVATGVLLCVSVVLAMLPHAPAKGWFRFTLGPATRSYWNDRDEAVPVTFKMVLEPRMFAGARYAVQLTFLSEDGTPRPSEQIPTRERPYIYPSRPVLVTEEISSNSSNLGSNASANGIEGFDELVQKCLDGPRTQAVVIDYPAVFSIAVRVVCIALVVATVGMVILSSVHLSTIEKRRRAGACLWCGYLLDKKSGSPCPECGRVPISE